jgi:hypothetical protein
MIILLTQGLFIHTSEELFKSLRSLIVFKNCPNLGKSHCDLPYGPIKAAKVRSRIQWQLKERLHVPLRPSIFPKQLLKKEL